MQRKQQTKRNDFDQASRYTARLDPVGFLCWLLHLNLDQFHFRGWLDTRNAPLPHAADRTSDTVALIEILGKAVEMWGLAVEFQIRPDGNMFCRILGYLAALLDRLLKDPTVPKNISVGAAIINLTGRGNASRIMDLPEVGIRTHLQIREMNLAKESAKELLQEIVSGTRSRALLPWIPLMTGGGDAAIIKEWKRLASSEPDRVKRADYGVLALVFAPAAKRLSVWREALKEWDMIESEVVTEWINKGIEKGIERGIEKGTLQGAIKRIER